MKIRKRDARVKDFDFTRIIRAVSMATNDVYGDMAINIKPILDDIQMKLDEYKKDIIDIEKVQDIILSVLYKHDRKIHKAYKSYREERSLARERTMYLKYKTGVIDKFSTENSNANVDENNFGGKQLRIVEDVLENICDEILVGKIKEDVKKGVLKCHDKSWFALGTHNCLLVDYPKLLGKTGVKTRQGDTKPAKNYNTACHLIPVITQSQSLDMFGGCGIMNFSIYMVEYLKYTISQYTKQYMSYTSDIDINTIPDHLSFKEAKSIVKDNFHKLMKYIDKDVRQANQALITNLVTLQSRSGHQLPFSSINIGLIDFENEEESAYIVEKFLLEIERGIGKLDRTAIFPITCYQVKKGVNRYPSDKYYHQRMTAQKVSHKRLYPTIVNGDFSHNVITSWESEMNMMGCRTMLGYNVNTGDYNRLGRGNNFPTTINLPYIALEQNGDIEKFFIRFKELLKEAHDLMMVRYEIAKSNPPSVAPFMYENKTIMGAEKCTDTVEEALKNNTFAFGYVGLAECLKVLTGFYHNQSQETQELGLKIVKTIKETCDFYTEKDNLNYSVYASPCEGYSKQGLDIIKRDFGVIEGVSDKDYLTNSHHVPVTEGENVFKKIDIESKYAQYALGGNIFHIEVDGVNYNEKAITKAIDYALDNDIPYIRISHPIATCMDCGHSTGRFMEKCEVCGSEEIENLAIVTGYLSTDISHMNSGKQAEVRDRKLNIDKK